MDMYTIAEEFLQQVVDSGATVRIIFTNGYQTPAKIINFDGNAIVAERNGVRWLIYTQAVSTIALA